MRDDSTAKYPRVPPAPEKKPFWSWQGVVVLIAMGGCLAGILVPVLQSARAAAKMTTCLSNVKDCALAQVMYAGANDDFFPDGGRWMDLTQQYRHYEAVPTCPYLAPGAGGYAMSRALSRKAAEKIIDPGITILIFETAREGKNVEAPEKEMLKMPRDSGGISIGFADGHAARRHSEAIR